jgi:hypothetical protein
MKKRLIAVLICLCMVVSVLPTAVFAAGEHSDHSGWQTLSGTLSTNTLAAGSYVLTGDVTLDKDVYLGELNKDDNIVICLNGHKIEGQEYELVASGSHSKNVTICDCSGKGEIQDTTVDSVANLNSITLDNCTIKAGAGQSVHLNSGTRVGSGCTVEAFSDGTLYIHDGCTIDSGAFISIWKSMNVETGGNLYIYGGSVASGIHIAYGCSAEISGGTVSGNITSNETLNITGGTISGSITVSNGTCNITGGTITTTQIYTSDPGEPKGAVVVKGGSCNIGGTAQITGNRVDYGGAVCVNGGTCTISGNNISGNYTTYGGVYVVDGTCTIEEGAVISNNKAFDQGGGVYVAGGVCNIYGTITKNYTAYVHEGDGGGVYVAGGECTIYGTVSSNTAARNGGGVYAAGGICTIYGSVEENNAVDGGGVYVAPGAQVYTRNGSELSRITENTASGNGGGVYLSDGTEWDNICDITRNTASYGGGIYGIDGCHLIIRAGSISENFADYLGGGLYLSGSSEKTCIVDITSWVIRENKVTGWTPNNIVNFSSKITYNPASSTQITLPYDEPNSIILKSSASFTIMNGKYKVDEAISCFDIQNNNQILIAGGYYDTDPSQESAFTIPDTVKIIKIDENTGDNSYDPNYPWSVYTVKDGLTGTTNSPVYDGQPIEKGTDFTLNEYASQMRTFYYWYKDQGADDNTYVSGLPTDAGNYTIKVGGLSLYNVGNEWYSECTFDLTISKAEPSYTLPVNLSGLHGGILSSVVLPQGWTWKDADQTLTTAGDMSFDVVFTPADTENYEIVEQTVTVTVEHDYGDCTYNGDGTHTSTCQYDGCSQTDTQDCSGGEATYFKQAECEICGGTYGVLKQDTTPPTGEICVNENKWNQFLNTITFGLFFKETQSVEITASDDSYSMDGYTEDKAAVIEYYLYSGDSALTAADLENKEFTVYNGTFNINPDNKYVIYARITDHANNQIYISSDGIILDASAPVVDGITNGGTYYVTQSVTVSDANLDSVTVNGTPIADETFILAGNTEETYTIIATDRAGNVTEYTVTMKPIANLEEQIKDLTTANVTSDHQKTVEAVKETIETMDMEDATEDEKAALQKIMDQCNELLGKIAEVAQIINGIETRLGAYTIDTIILDDEPELGQLKEDIEQVLIDYNRNFTENEKLKLGENLKAVEEMLDSLARVKDVEGTVQQLPDTVEPDDTDTEQLINEAKKQYDELTDHEESLVSEESREKLEKLLGELRDYEIVMGDGSKWKKGMQTGLVFTANGAYSKFTGIEVDGKAVDADYYTAVSGSTVITLKAEYLETLSVGKHTLTVLYPDGETSCEFEVLTKDGTTPKTDDSSNILLWIVLLVVSGGVISTVTYRKKKQLN